MTSRNTTIDKHVEILCEQGCRAVLDYIEALQAGQSRPEFADLNAAERELLRQELQAIMSIYDNRCKL